MKSCDLERTTRDFCWAVLLQIPPRASTKAKCFIRHKISKAGLHILAKQNSRDNRQKYKISKV